MYVKRVVYNQIQYINIEMMGRCLSICKPSVRIKVSVVVRKNVTYLK